MFSSYYMDKIGHVSPNKMNETDVRVVVISPEDREQVERLAKGLPVMWNLFQPDDPELGEETVSAFQTALREFANPTPPKCPSVLHLGAERVECERDPGHSMTDHRNDSIGQGVRWSA